ncbi:MAG: hypothetical protein Q9227_009316 [Pyrenula ochraceoflavens]
MQLLIALLSLFAAFPSLTVAQSVKTTQISYEPVDDSPNLTNLASVSYDAESLDAQLLTWTPPSLADRKLASSRLLRLHTSSGSSTLTTLSAFNDTLQQILSLHLDSTGNVLSASISARPPPSPAQNELGSQKGKSNQSKKSKSIIKEDTVNPQVVLVPTTPGPLPKLNQRKPVKLDEGGREVPQQEEQPKSFLQKYWWVFLLVTVLALSGGGDK